MLQNSKDGYGTSNKTHIQLVASCVGERQVNWAFNQTVVPCMDESMKFVSKDFKYKYLGRGTGQYPEVLFFNRFSFEKVISSKGGWWDS